MSGDINPIAGNQNVDAASAQEQASNPAKITAQNAETTFVTNEKTLKEVAPEVHRAFVEGVMRKIIGDMRKHQQRMKKLMRENTSH